MAYANPTDFHPAHVHTAANARRGFWRKIFDAVGNAQQRQAQRDIEFYVARRGRLTDSMERELAERAMGGRWNIPR